METTKQNKAIREVMKIYLFMYMEWKIPRREGVLQMMQRDQLLS